MPWFEIATPDGRVIRQEHASIEALRGAMTTGYRPLGKLIGCDANGQSGLVIAIAPDGAPAQKSILGLLLDECGDELEVWLASKGYEPH